MTKNEKRLFEAACKNDQAEAEAALKGGFLSKAADINCRDEEGNTPLLCVTDNVAMMDWLAGRGADLVAVNKHGHTALLKASCSGQTASVLWLLDHGVPVDLQNGSDGTALMVAFSYGQAEIVELLLSRGADINATDSQGKTALINAATHGNADLARLLIAKGADLNRQDVMGYSPLLRAAAFGKPEVTRLLIDNRADLTIKLTESKKTALDLALEERDWRSSRMLRENGVIADFAWFMEKVRQDSDRELLAAISDAVVIQPEGVDLACRKCGKSFRIGRNAIVMSMAEVMGGIAQRGGTVVGADALAAHPDMVGDCPWDNLDEKDKKIQRELTLEVKQGKRAREWTCQKCQETQPYPKVQS